MAAPRSSVYNRSLDDESEATAVDIKGTVNVDNPDVALPGPANLGDGDTNASLATITWASGSIKITPKISKRATFEAEVVAGGKTISKASDEGGEEVSLALAANATSPATGAVPGGDLVNTVNVRVLAENGYHDTEFSFDVSRANPVDAQLTGLVFGLARTQTNGAHQFSFDPAEDEQVANVPVGTGTGNTMPLYIRATGKALQGGMEVSHNGTVIDAMAPQSNQHALVSDYRISIPRTGDLQGEVVDITVTSEDGKKFNYEISLLRGDVPSVATLSGLTVSVGGTNQISFASGTTSYDVDVAHDVGQVVVNPSAASGATATVSTSTTGASVASDGITVNLAPRVRRRLSR